MFTCALQSGCVGFTVCPPLCCTSKENPNVYLVGILGACKYLPFLLRFGGVPDADNRWDSLCAICELFYRNVCFIRLICLDVKAFLLPPPYVPLLPPGGEFWYGIRKWKGGEEKAGGGMETEREMKRKRDIEGGKGRGGEEKGKGRIEEE